MTNERPKHSLTRTISSGISPQISLRSEESSPRTTGYTSSQQILKSGEAVDDHDIEFLLRKDQSNDAHDDSSGKSDPLNETLTPVRDPKNELIQGKICDGQDITEEEQLLSNENENRHVVSDSTVNSCNDRDGNKESGMITLEKDVYSILSVSGPSHGMLYSILVIGFQLTIIDLLAWDVVRDFAQPDGDRNPFNVPISVEPQVRSAQFLAIPLALMVHRDSITAIRLLQAKYEVERIEPHAPNAKRWAWFLSLLLRFITGVSQVSVSFVLILQSDRIISMFLNLAALVFVGEIDDFGYFLANSGFLKKELTEACDRTQHIALRPWRGTGRTVTRRALLVLFYIALLSIWISVVVRQEQGFFLQTTACSSFSVRFGSQEFPVRVADIDFGGTIRNYSYTILFNDETGEPLKEKIASPFSSFTGTYRIGNLKRRTLLADGRAIYYETASNSSEEESDKTTGIFRFCKDGPRSGNWIFKIKALADATHPQPDKNDCSNWLLRSPPTSSFLLEDVSGSWQVWTGTITEAVGLTIQCDDCQDDFGCNLKGTCSRGFCTCDHGVLGRTCTFPKPCESFSAHVVGSESTEFIKAGRYEIMRKDTFELNKTRIVEPQLAYGRPIFFQNLYNSSIVDLSFVVDPLFNTNDQYPDDDLKNESCTVSDPPLGVLFYSGDRWLSSYLCASDALSRFFDPTAPSHAFWDQSYDDSVDAFSEPTLSSTPQSIQWNLRLDSQSIGDFGFFGPTEPYELSFVCLDTDCTGRCGSNGKCDIASNTCECTNCYGGTFCEYPPYSRYAREEFVAARAFQEGANPDYYPSPYYNAYWANINMSSCFF